MREDIRCLPMQSDKILQYGVTIEQEIFLE